MTMQFKFISIIKYYIIIDRCRRKLFRVEDKKLFIIGNINKF
jgi:hypothetical protein